MTNYSFQAVGPIFIITGSVTYNILNIGFTVIDMDVLDNEQLLLVKKGLQYNYLVSPDSVDVLAYIASNAIESGTTSPEQIADSIGAIIIGQNGAQVTYDDNGNQIVIEVPTLDNKVDKITGYGLSQNDYTDKIAELVEAKTRVFNDTMSGAIGTGGDLTLTGGITFSVSAGYGYAKDPLGNTVLIEWTDPITGSTAVNGDNFIYVNYLGQIVQQSTRDSANHIYIGYIRTGFGNTQIVGYSPVKFTIKDYYFHLSKFITTGIGTIIEDGCNLSLQPNPDQLKVTLGSGKLWIDLTDKVIADTSTFTKLFGTSDYGFIPDTVTTANTINNAYINVRTNNHLTALVPMTTGYYKKDLFFVTPEGALYYIYATEEYATEELALAASIPQVPEQIKHLVARVGSIIIQQGATAVVDVYDIRPMFSKLFQTGTPSSPTVVIDHGDLIGLNDDDHLLYHTDARGDIRYHTRAEITALLLGKADVVHTHVISDVTGLQTALNGKEATITATTSADYYRGDKTFATLNKTAVGLGSVPDVDATNASNISSGTLANARLSANLTQIGNDTFANGEIIQSFSGTLQNASLGVGVTGAVQITNSAGSILFDAPYAKGPLNQKSGFFEDFITYSATVVSPYLLRTVSGVGATTSIAAALSSGDNRNGVIVFSTGITAGGAAGAASGSLSSINFANIPVGGYEEFGACFKLPAVSDPVQSFQIVAGFGDSASGLVPVDGAYISIGGGTTGFQSNTSSNNTITSSDSLLTTVANTYYVIRIIVSNIAGSLSASYFVNGTQLGTAVTTNIPSGAGREMGIQFGIAKILGTTPRTVELDWIYYESFKPRTINY